jgi:predicted kinase
MLCDAVPPATDPRWPPLQHATFRLYATIIEMRMQLGCPVISDAVNLSGDLLGGLRRLAQQYQYRTLLVVFDLPLETCLLQNTQRDVASRILEAMIRAQR